MVKIMKNIRAEFHRLTMPSKMQVLKDTVFVIAAALISSALIGAKEHVYPLVPFLTVGYIITLIILIIQGQHISWLL